MNNSSGQLYVFLDTLNQETTTVCLHFK